MGKHQTKSQRRGSRIVHAAYIAKGWAIEIGHLDADAGSYTLDNLPASMLTHLIRESPLTREAVVRLAKGAALESTTSPGSPG